jgi:hypothetical protein
MKQSARTLTPLVAVAIAALLGGCENTSTSQKGTLTGAALGSGIGMVASGSFGQVVGAGLIGAAVGYLGGSAVSR